MKKTTYLLLLSCLVIFQSCFEIIEQLSIKNDGSGNFQLVINLSKSKTKLNSIMKMKTVNGHKVPSKEEIKQKIEGIEKLVSKTTGLSNVKTTVDFENYIANINCDFKTVEQLNNAFKSINDKEKGNNKEATNVFAYDIGSNIFTRLNKFSLKGGYDKLTNADKEVFETANYTAIYKFESNIEKASNINSTISPSKKAIMLKQSVLSIIANKKAIENKINLSK